MKYIDSLGNNFLARMRDLGEWFFLMGAAIARIPLPPYRLRQLLREVAEQGANSFFIVAVASFATGMVLAFQSGAILMRFGAEIYVARLVSLSMVRELGPVLGAIIFTGKAGSKMAAELGTMSVNEQILATRAMALDPIEFLIKNRVLACIIAVPMLVVMADFLGVFGGYIICVHDIGTPPSTYMNQIWESLYLKDFLSGMAKSVVFALLIASICCYKGLKASGGSEGVGRAVTEAVALSCIAVVLSDFVMTKFVVTFIDKM